jgi:hypothetical protein
MVGEFECLASHRVPCLVTPGSGNTGAQADSADTYSERVTRHSENGLDSDAAKDRSQDTQINRSKSACAKLQRKRFKIKQFGRLISDYPVQSVHAPLIRRLRLG